MMMFLDALSRLIPRLGVTAFALLIALLIAVHVFSAIDWLWFLPDFLFPSTSESTVPSPGPRASQGCITMPDGTTVCDGPAENIADGMAIR